jgi:hypothetical protein
MCVKQTNNTIDNAVVCDITAYKHRIDTMNQCVCVGVYLGSMCDNKMYLECHFVKYTHRCIISHV